MTGLRSACLKVVIASINLDSVCHHMLLAHDHKCSELSQVRGVTWREGQACICTVCQSQAGIGEGIRILEEFLKHARVRADVYPTYLPCCRPVSCLSRHPLSASSRCAGACDSLAARLVACALTALD